MGKMKCFKAKTCVNLMLSMMLISMVIILSGCGLGEKNEKKLFDSMKEEGFLDLKCNYEDYDEVREVSQSPVPANIRYYDYNQDGKIYSIDYSSRILGEDDSVYQVRVTINTGDDSDTKVYYFEKDSFKYRAVAK